MQIWDNAATAFDFYFVYSVIKWQLQVNSSMRSPVRLIPCTTRICYEVGRVVKGKIQNVINFCHFNCYLRKKQKKTKACHTKTLLFLIYYCLLHGFIYFYLFFFYLLLCGTLLLVRAVINIAVSTLTLTHNYLLNSFLRLHGCNHSFFHFLYTTSCHFCICTHYKWKRVLTWQKENDVLRHKYTYTYKANSWGK